MKSVSLPELFGVRGSSVQWDRVLLFSASTVIAKVASFAIGYTVSYSADAGFSASWFRFGPPWELLLILAGQVAELLVFIPIFRAVRREYAALVLAALTYGLLYTPVNLWLLTLVLGPFQGSWTDVAVTRFATRVYYSLAFYGVLMLVLRRGRSLGMSLFISAVLGTALGDVAATLVQAATNPSSRLIANLGFVAWGAPRILAYACAFTGTLVGGLRLGRAVNEEAVSSSQQIRQ